MFDVASSPVALEKWISIDSAVLVEGRREPKLSRTRGTVVAVLEGQDR
jgi:hypothetical protein